jgi:superfamily II DNA or RNA helicase
VDELKASLAKKRAGASQIHEAVQTLRQRQRDRRPSGKEIGLQAQERAKRQAELRAKTIKLLEYFDFVIGEEAHEAGGNSYYEILRHCKNAYYRLALTATPFMRPDAEANIRLMAAFGPIGTQISEKLLIDRGILATPYFKRISTEAPPLVKRGSSWQRAYKLGIVENDFRNRAIVVEVLRGAQYGLSAMVLVQRKDHGRRLRDMLRAAGLRVQYIFGEHDQEERERALEQLKVGKLHVLIGSTILDVGVDVPAVGMIVLAGGGKAEVALRQRIGRGMRAKKFGPNVALIVDFTDRWNNHLRDHALTRFSIVDQTPGFAESVLPPGTDFDFEALGFMRIGA